MTHSEEMPAPRDAGHLVYPTHQMTRRGFLGASMAGAAALGTVGHLLGIGSDRHANYGAEARGGWHKYLGNPVLGGTLGTCFDVCVLQERVTLRMWFSWRPERSIAMTESHDGIHWSTPKLALRPSNSGWETDVNRPVVVRNNNQYHMWYTGQTQRISAIGHAVSSDGFSWRRMGVAPELRPEQSWEKGAVMCPDVLWSVEDHRYRMWYSAGGQYEPDAIGLAQSADGVHWSRMRAEPVFLPDRNHAWEGDKVTACHVVRDGDWYIMFYIGFADPMTARIGLARSRNGIDGWQRHPRNPIIQPSSVGGAWDYDAVYKPFALRLHDRWVLWYNGRRGSTEQIGMAIHRGTDLGFA